MTTTQTNEANAGISCIKLNGYKIELGQHRNGKPVARFFKLLTMGRNKGTYKMLNGYFYGTEQRREESIKEFIANIQKTTSDKEQKSEIKKAIRDNMNHPFKVGQIYYDSWGYDQTNIDFYEVVEVNGKSLVMREIGAKAVEGTQGHDCQNVKPIAGKYFGEPIKKIIQFYIQQDGTPRYYIKSNHGAISLYTKEDNGIYSSWGH